MRDGLESSRVRFKDKTVVVTGGGSGIGRAIALAFAREGTHVTVAEIDAGQGEKTAVEAKKVGAASAVVIQTDVTKPESVQAMVREVEGRTGKIDVLVNNVGWTLDRLFVEKERAEWEKEVQINLWGMINCTRAVLDGMIARKGGVIVSLGSDAGSEAPEGPFLESNPHPRAYGNFARLLGKYVRDEHALPLAEAIRRLSSFPAENMHLRARGRLAPGFFGDVVVFDPATIQDHATFENPHQFASGVRDVFVNGTQVLADGVHTGALPGRVVRGPGWTGWKNARP